MKRLLCVLLALMMVLGLGGCKKKEAPNEVPNTGTIITKADTSVQDYVDKYGKQLTTAFKSSFEASSGGFTCDCDIRAVGTEIIIDCCVNGLDNVPAEGKAQMQAIYDESKDALMEPYEEMKKELPSLTGFTINVCEEDGDLLANLVLKF